MRSLISFISASLMFIACGQEDTSFVQSRTLGSEDAISAGVDDDAETAIPDSIASATDALGRGIGDESLEGDLDGSQDGNNSNNDGNSDNNSGDNGEGDLNFTPPTAEEVIANCQNSTISKQIVQISFPAKQNCSWGSKVDDGNGGFTEVLSANGNLSIKNNWIRAREEQTVSIQVPHNAQLCGLDLQSDNDQIHFDDFFALRLEDYVVASSKVLTNALLQDEAGHYLWDWDRIRGDGSEATGTVMQNIGKFCGTGECQLPEHDTPGAFGVQFSLSEGSSTENNMNAALFAKLSHLEEIKMTATATGDNDTGDCDHSGGSFEVELSYISK